MGSFKLKGLISFLECIVVFVYLSNVIDLIWERWNWWVSWV